MAGRWGGGAVILHMSLCTLHFHCRSAKTAGKQQNGNGQTAEAAEQQEKAVGGPPAAPCPSSSLAGFSIGVVVAAAGIQRHLTLKLLHLRAAGSRRQRMRSRQSRAEQSNSGGWIGGAAAAALAATAGLPLPSSLPALFSNNTQCGKHEEMVRYYQLSSTRSSSSSSRRGAPCA